MTLNFEDILKYLGIAFLFLAAIIITSVSANSCNSKIQDQDIPDVAYKARALGGFDTGWRKAKSSEYLIHADTTKLPNSQMKTKTVITHYTLSGSDTLFNLLWMQINSPIDITPRQLNALKDWMQRSLKADSTNR